MLSDVAKQHTSEGALAFASYFIKALDWSLATTDPYLLQEISAPTCKSCAEHINAILDLDRHGGVLIGGRLQLNSARLVSGKFKISSEYQVEIDVSQVALQIQAPTTMSSAPAQRSKSVLFLSWNGTGWTVLEQGVA